MFGQLFVTYVPDHLNVCLIKCMNTGMILSGSVINHLWLAFRLTLKSASWALNAEFHSRTVHAETTFAKALTCNVSTISLTFRNEDLRSCRTAGFNCNCHLTFFLTLGWASRSGPSDARTCYFQTTRVYTPTLWALTLNFLVSPILSALGHMWSWGGSHRLANIWFLENGTKQLTQLGAFFCL